MASASQGRRRPLRRLLRFVGLMLLVLLVGLPAAGLLAYRWFPVPATPLMVIRSVEGESWHHTWTPLDTMSPWVVRSVIASEDARFCGHRGFDTVELRRALAAWRAGEGLRGASTLSQQTVKNLFLWPGRQWIRKGLEAWLTPWLELAWPKRRIVEVYLNIVEWGPGVYGIGAASQYYFGVPPRQLTAAQAARLAVVLPAPRHRTPTSNRPPVPALAAVVARRARLVRLGPNNTPCPPTSD